MGKYSGKLLTVYITPTGVRVCEGDNRNGDPNITQFFVVSGVQDYFSGSPGSRDLTITNLSGLVAAIVAECKEHRVSSKRMMLCSDCFGLQTQIVTTEVVGGIKDLLAGDLKNLGRRKVKDEFGEDTPDLMSCKCSWGDLTMDGAVKHIVSKTTGDKFMLRSMIQEFYKYGYEVIHISGGVETLINFRETEQASFDSQGKIIFDFDIDCRAVVLVKDLPVQIIKLGLPEREAMLDRLMSMLKSALPVTGRNPRIYIVGSVFADCELYCRFIDHLESEGYTVYDLFNRPNLPDNYEESLANGEMPPMLTPDYTMNIAMLMAPFVKIMPQLTPTVGLGDMVKKNSKAIATLVLGAACLSVVVSFGFAAHRFMQLQSMESDPSNLSNLQSQVQTLTTRQTSLNATIATLTQADTTVLNLLNFTQANQSDRVVIVSIDTRDMLPGDGDYGNGVSVNDANDGSSSEVFTGETGGQGKVRENLVIRGYAKSGNEAVSWYHMLYNSGLANDPVLNGVERYELPDGDEVYIFEIEIGEVGLE